MPGRRRVTIRRSKMVTEVGGNELGGGMLCTLCREVLKRTDNPQPLSAKKIDSHYAKKHREVTIIEG